MLESGNIRRGALTLFGLLAATTPVVALEAGIPVTVRFKHPDGAPEPKAGADVHMTGEHKGAAVFEVV